MHPDSISAVTSSLCFLLLMICDIIFRNKLIINPSPLLKEENYLVTHKDHGLLVFVDASPSEQIDLKSNSKICFTSIVCDNEEGISGLHQFKVGSWKQKLKRAHIFSEAIEQDTVSIHAFSITARQNTFTPWAVDILNQSRKSIGARWKEDTKTFCWNGIEFPRSQTLGIGAYASVLTIIGLNVAHWLKNIEINKATIVLDNLPLGSIHGMALMHELVKNSFCGELWDENCRTAKGNFTITNMESYTDKHGKTYSAKNHPHFIIADWLAAYLRAQHDPESFKGKNKPRQTNEVAVIAKIWQKLAAKGTAVERDLDDPDLMSRVIKHSENNE